MQKFFVTIGEITLAVYGEDSNTVYDTLRLLYPGFEVGYPTEDDPIPQPVELNENTCNQEVCDMPKYKADARCKRLHDWHYFGSRVVIKRLNK